MNKKVRSIAVSVFMILSFVVIIVDITHLVEAPTTIYVPTDYPTIQEAIDAAQTGDTVYVYSGTYYEDIIIDKTINLVGQNRDTTVIQNATEYESTIWILAGWVNITGFTINGSDAEAIIAGFTSYNTISGNNILDSGQGIALGGSYNKVESNYLESNEEGIHLEGSSNNIIKGNVVTSNYYYGINFFRDAHNNKIINNKICNNNYGIYMDTSTYNNISGNNISLNDWDGILIEHFNHGNNISSNIISNNGLCGIHLDYGSDKNNVINNYITSDSINLDDSNGNNIAGNTMIEGGIFIEDSNGNNITNNTMIKGGILLKYSSRNNITGNDILNNGIMLEDSSGNNITDNTMIEGGILIEGDQLEYWNTHNIDTTNTVNGKPVFYLKNQISETVPEGAGQVILANSTKVTIDNQELKNSSVGVEVGFSSHINITGNNVSSNKWIGVYLYRSNNNNISYNNISFNDWDGIYLYPYSNNNIILGNNISSNGKHGLHMSYSSENNISDNIILSNDFGIYPYFSNGNNIICNTVLNNTDGIHLGGCTGNNIIGNNASSNIWIGIRLDASGDNKINDNFVSHNYWGMLLYHSNENNFIGNNISSNRNDGIKFCFSMDNVLINCSISNSSSYDFHFEDNSHTTTINTTFNKTKLYYNDSLSTLTVKWFLDVSVIDDMGNPVPNANVKVEDNLNGSYNETFSTSGDGHVRWIPVTEYVENYYGKTYYTPHRIIAWNDTKVGCVDPEPFIDQSKTVTIVLHNGTLLDLESGWNLISLPRPQLTTNIQTVLQSIEGRYDAAQWYDVSKVNDPWKHYHISKPSSMNDLDELNHTMGFWLHIIEPEGTTLVIFGDELTSSQNIPLYPGWNLVGYPSKTNETRDIALGTLNFGSDVDSIWNYNATTQKWIELDEPTDYFEIGQGYWVHSKVEKVWNVPL